MMRKKTAVLFLLMALMLNGCGVQQSSVPVVAPAAKEETMQIAQEEMEQPLEQPVQQIEVTELREESEVRAGSSEDTLATLPISRRPTITAAASNRSGNTTNCTASCRSRKITRPFSILHPTPPKSRCCTCGRKGCPGTDRIYRKHDRLLRQL